MSSLNNNMVNSVGWGGGGGESKEELKSSQEDPPDRATVAFGAVKTRQPLWDSYVLRSTILFPAEFHFW